MRQEHKKTTVPFTRFKEIHEALNEKQLAGIGKVALAFNRVESSINGLLVDALAVKPLFAFELSSRFSSVDSKIAIVKRIGCLIGVPEDMRAVLKNTLGEHEFLKLKSCRNGVIHSRILDAENQIGHHSNNRGKKFDILLSPEALDGLYERLCLMHKELNQFILIYRISHRIKSGRDSGTRKTTYEESLKSYFLKSQSYRCRRLSLPQFPEFPEPHPFPQEWESA